LFDAKLDVIAQPQWNITHLHTLPVHAFRSRQYQMVIFGNQL